MNFYKHHIGDYAAATAHLSFTEDAAYTRLLRIYYRDERPLPVEIRAVQRLAGARMPEELEAVETVLREFFRLTDDGWHNKRCDEEIGEFHLAESEAGARRENEAERQRRHRERRKELFAELRTAGVVPAYDTPTSELETMLSQKRTRPVTRTATANQTPDSTIQTPVQEQKLCPEPQAASAPAVITMPLNTGPDFPITQAKVDEFAELYPAVNIMTELRKMRGWLVNNPTKRKTKGGILRYVNAWLAKEQDKSLPTGAFHETHRKLCPADQVRAHIARAEASTPSLVNGHANPVGEDGRDLRPPLDGEFWRESGH